MRRPPSLFRRWQLPSVARTIAACSLLAGCYSAGDGISPPGERIYFPVGLALTTDAKYLAVVNSDFDLQYNAGTLATLSVEALGQYVAQPCDQDSHCSSGQCDVDGDPANGEGPSYVCVADKAAPDPCLGLGVRPAAERLLFPGRCEYIDPEKHGVLADHVQIGAFATDAVFLPDPDRNVEGRLFVPVRGDATLHWANIDANGTIDCGQGLNSHGACNGAHRAGDDPEQENTRDIRLAPEPFGVAVDPEGKAVVVTNQTSGRVSIFSHEWQANDASALQLQFEVTNLATRPMSIAALPTPKYATMTLNPTETYAPGFLVTFRNAPQVDLIRYFPDTVSNPGRPYASRANAVPITINSIGTDSRGIAIDDSVRVASEAECDATHGRSSVSDQCKGDNAACTQEEQEYIACLRKVASTSLDVFIASRAPSSLLVGKTTPAENALQSTELPAFFDSISMTQGPSRVVTGKVIVGPKDGPPTYEPRVFVSCFDSRRVFIYDPIRRRIDTEIMTGRGPHALAVDEARGWLFVGHFTDSFIGVVSLDTRFTHTYGKILATVGEPSAPRASK